ncbi:hypothetical protein RSOL_195550, partial [Rhizoctonia solani AG-3 Rhs1AP]
MVPEKSRKRKHQINDEDISEERTSKRILQSQQNHGLQDFQDISLVPANTLTMAELQDQYDLPNLLSNLKAGGYPFAAMINSMATEPAVADPILYAKEGFEASSGTLSSLQLSDCQAGRLQLIFRVILSPPELATNPVIACIHRFLPIPSNPETATGMLLVLKPPRIQAELIHISRILRICPLSPHITGHAIPGVTAQTTLDQYNSFYLNKYHSISDFLFLNGIRLN